MPKFNSVLFLLLCAVFFSIVSGAAADEDVLRIPQDLDPSLDQLLGLTRHDSQAQPDMTAIRAVVEYILTPKDLAATYSAGQRKGATSNYYEFPVDRPIETMLDLAYSPEIPSYFTVPASLHQSNWIEVDGKQQPFPDLSHVMRTPFRPMLIKGVEAVQNTPDTNSGAYYAYTLDRAVVLTRHQGRRVLLSMSAQRGISDVGKKGLVVGSDDDWNYIYTGEKGCTIPGMGWADTYMYDSESIIVYYEMIEPVPHVRCAVFKWVHAGWAGVNMAQTVHIKNGVQRFAKNLKEVIESTSLPLKSELAAVIRRIESLPTHTLKEKVRDYFNTLKARHQDDSRLNRKWFTLLFKDDHYVEQMNRKELTAALCKEYLKYLLGKTHGFDIAFLENAKTQPKHPG